MAKRGHACGVVSTFFTTWVLKTDGRGTLWVSDGIAHSATGSDTQASVTQVCAPQHMPVLRLVSLRIDRLCTATLRASACSAPAVLQQGWLSICILGVLM